MNNDALKTQNNLNPTPINNNVSNAALKIILPLKAQFGVIVLGIASFSLIVLSAAFFAGDFEATLQGSKLFRFLGAAGDITQLLILAQIVGACWLVFQIQTIRLNNLRKEPFQPTLSRCIGIPLLTCYTAGTVKSIYDSEALGSDKEIIWNFLGIALRKVWSFGEIKEFAKEQIMLHYPTLLPETLELASTRIATLANKSMATAKEKLADYYLILDKHVVDTLQNNPVINALQNNVEQAHQAAAASTSAAPSPTLKAVVFWSCVGVAIVGTVWQLGLMKVAITKITTSLVSLGAVNTAQQALNTATNAQTAINALATTELAGRSVATGELLKSVNWDALQYFCRVLDKFSHNSEHKLAIIETMIRASANTVTPADTIATAAAAASTSSLSTAVSAAIQTGAIKAAAIVT